MEDEHTFTAFVGVKRIATGSLEHVLTAVKPKFDDDQNIQLTVFEDQTGREVDFDFQGTLDAVLARALPTRTPSGPGRPKLGVISREVSLLPRHWDWLEQQPNGASAALRKLVDQARKLEPGEQRARLATDAAGRFLSAMAGNLPGYEEATRALYSRDRDRLEELIGEWPQDIRIHVQWLVQDVFEGRSLKTSNL